MQHSTATRSVHSRASRVTTITRGRGARRLYTHTAIWPPLGPPLPRRIADRWQSTGRTRQCILHGTLIVKRSHGRRTLTMSHVSQERRPPASRCRAHTHAVPRPSLAADERRLLSLLEGLNTLAAGKHEEGAAYQPEERGERGRRRAPLDCQGVRAGRG